MRCTVRIRWRCLNTTPARPIRRPQQRLQSQPQSVPGTVPETQLVSRLLSVGFSFSYYLPGPPRLARKFLAELEKGPLAVIYVFARPLCWPCRAFQGKRRVVGKVLRLQLDLLAPGRLANAGRHDVEPGSHFQPRGKDTWPALRMRKMPGLESIIRLMLGPELRSCCCTAGIVLFKRTMTPYHLSNGRPACPGIVPRSGGVYLLHFHKGSESCRWACRLLRWRLCILPRPTLVVVISWVPLTAIFIPSIGGESRFRFNRPNLVTYDVGHDLDIDPKVRCAPPALSTWWAAIVPGSNYQTPKPTEAYDPHELAVQGRLRAAGATRDGTMLSAS